MPSSGTAVALPNAQPLSSIRWIAALFMLRKIYALWLVGLITLPFTVPFPTCDLTDLLGGAASRHGTPAPESPSPGAVDDASALLVPPVATTAGRLKLRVLAGLRSAQSIAPLPIASIDRPSISTTRQTPTAPLTTILRV
jgi:hypothetical protein